jgi:hypothetical protein
VTPREQKAAQDRLYKQAKEKAVDNMGGKRAFWIMGSSIRQAFVAQAILSILALQDDAVPAESVRTMLNALYERMTDDTGLLSEYGY